MNEDGPTRMMLCVTKVLRPGPARISQIGRSITLPRAWEIRKIVAVGVGMVALAAPAAIGTRNPTSVVFALALGAVAGVVAVSWSPMRNESMATWLGLEVRARAGRHGARTPDGEAARAYVGVCPITRLPAGKVRVVPGAVDVPGGSVDGRGLPVDADHSGLVHQLPEKHHRAPELVIPDFELPAGVIRPRRTYGAHAPLREDQP